VLEDYCKQCSKVWQLSLESLCSNCKNLLKEEITYWRSMHIVLENYDHPTLADGLKMHPQMEMARK